MLRYCHSVLADRIARGGRLLWQWELKDRVAVHLAAYLADSLPPGSNDPKPPLSQTEMQAALASHPLLQEIRDPPLGSPILPGRIAELHARVRSLVAHARGSQAALDANTGRATLARTPSK